MHGHGWKVVAAVALALAGCFGSQSGDETPGKEGTGSSSFSPGDVSSCGGGCSADLSAARAALEAGDFAGAYDYYRCADSPEAAFGAGLTRTLTAIESTSADALLEDLGLPPLPASDVLGPDGVLARASKRYNGSGSLTLSGALGASFELSRVRHSVEVDPGFGSYYSMDALDFSSARAKLEVYWDTQDGEALPAGTRQEQTYDCLSSFARTSSGPFGIDLSLTVTGVDYYCSMPYGLDAASCETDGGSITLLSAGTAPGDAVELSLDSVLLGCEEDGGDAPPIGAGAGRVVRVSGRVSATTVADDLDTSGLHPIFSADEPLGNVRDDRTVTDFLQHAAGVTSELVLASCYFDRAAQGSGVVGTIPGALYAGQDADATAADARVLSAATGLLAAAGEIVSAYEVSMPLDMLVCGSTEASSVACDSNGVCESSDPTSDCPSDAETAAAFNAGLGRTVDAARFQNARGLVQTALERLDAGLAELDEGSLLASGPDSAAGIAQLRDLAQAGVAAFGGRTALPHVTPTIYFDLGRFFASPPARGDITEEPLAIEESCDDFDCYTDVYLNGAFLEALLEGALEADFENGDYQWSDDQALETTLETAARSVAAATALPLN